MKIAKKIRVAEAVCLTVLLFGATSCSTVAITGRKQLNLVSSQEVLSLSNQSFASYMKEAKPSTNVEKANMVTRVGRNIANAVEEYLRAHGKADEIKQYAWEFHLIKDQTANAFCMPGGKIVVNEGILPYTQTEEGLAVVIGHEVAHAVANHSAERMSQQMLAGYGGVALGALTQGQSEANRSLAMQVYGLGAQYGVMLPYSRLNENEADHLGLIFMAMAGYNPRAAVPFWQRMSQGGGANVPEFMSTHPSDATRIKKLEQTMPEALKYYKKPGTSSFRLHF